MKKLIPILTFIILISFCVILIFLSYDQFDIDNDSRAKDSISFVLSFRGGVYKPKHFDKNFHRILQKGFPDWKERIEYQKKQEELYKSAQKKLKMSPLGISSSEENWDKIFSPEEKDAIAYFQGTGFYQEYQKVGREPNIFDTREIFLFKPQDKDTREKSSDTSNIYDLQSNLSEKNLE